MEKNLRIWQWTGFTFAVVFGSLLHFVFVWTKSYALAPVSAVNESTWEHMKILFFPLLVFALVQSRYASEYPAFWWIKCIGILAGVVSIPILFYTYNGAFGESPDWVNISIFFLSAGIAFLVETHLFKTRFAPSFAVVGLIILLIIGLLFAVFTFAPPKLPLFQDPITSRYGI